MTKFKIWTETIILIMLTWLAVMLSSVASSQLWTFYFWIISVYAFNSAFNEDFLNLIRSYWSSLKSALKPEPLNKNQILDDIDFPPKDEPSNGGKIGPKDMTNKF